MDDYIELLNQTDNSLDPSAAHTIHTVLQFFMKRYHLDDAMLTVLVVDPDTIRELNWQYRGKNTPTDILSFGQYTDLEEISAAQAAGEPVHVGDLVLCLEEVRENCREHFVDFHEETARLIIHGMLHIIGKVHQSYDASEEMLITQEQLLSEYVAARSAEN